MAVSTQEILNGVINMQANAQQALPVIPNNGNPAGAYNMPMLPQHRAVGQPPVAAQPMVRQPQAPLPTPPQYPWLAPSQSATNIRTMLEGRRDRFQQPVQDVMQQRGQLMNDQMPVLPMRR
jgi:hypothetical protein